jgi:hypothetical protein
MGIALLAVQAALAGTKAWTQWKADNAALIAAAKESDLALLATLDAQIEANEADANAADAEANSALGKSAQI